MVIHAQGVRHNTGIVGRTVHVHPGNMDKAVVPAIVKKAGQGPAQKGEKQNVAKEISGGVKLLILCVDETVGAVPHAEAFRAICQRPGVCFLVRSRAVAVGKAAGTLFNHVVAVHGLEDDAHEDAGHGTAQPGGAVAADDVGGMPGENVIGFQDEHPAVLGGRFPLQDILVRVADKDKGAVPAPLLREPRVQPFPCIGNALRLLEAQTHIRMVLAEAQDALQHGVVITSVAVAVRADKHRQLPGRRFGNRPLAAPGQQNREEKNGANV